MKKILLILSIVVLTAIAAFLLGPKPPKPVYSNQFPSVSADLTQLEAYVKEIEMSHRLKPDNEARFIWANDTLKEKTEYSLLYLPGFAACWFEGSPVNTDFVSHFECNAYFARLASHGIDTTDALADMTPDRLWESAKEALAIAEMIGKKVIIMGTSTGSTLALKLAAEFPDKVTGLILYSPNMEINNSAAFIVSGPWGLQIARKIQKSHYRITNEDTASTDCHYWICKQRLEAVVYLQQLVETMAVPEIFSKVKVPVFVGYYYKDEENQDKVVKVDAILKMYDELGTEAGLKQKQPFPEAGDHVIASGLFSKSIDEVRNATFRFAEDILKM